MFAVVGQSRAGGRPLGTPLAFLFIDGGHGEEPARLDYERWTPHVVVGGTLAIHDVFPDPADGGRPPYEQIFKPALDSGRFRLEQRHRQPAGAAPRRLTRRNRPRTSGSERRSPLSRYRNRRARMAACRSNEWRCWVWARSACWRPRCCTKRVSRWWVSTPARHGSPPRSPPVSPTCRRQPRWTRCLGDAQAVLSCLPYHLNLGLAEVAHALGLHYFDLTEDVPTTKAIIQMSATVEGVMAPQCGLAPGFVGIVAASQIASSTPAARFGCGWVRCRNTPRGCSATRSTGRPRVW